MGHFVHAIDISLFSSLGKRIKKIHDTKPNFTTQILNNLLNGHRIRGLLHKHWKIEKEFIDVASYCSDNVQYDEAKYWSYLNDSFKGYTIIFFVFSISGIIRGEIILGLVLIGLAILFRQRGRFFGIYYIEAITRIYHNKQNYQKGNK